MARAFLKSNPDSWSPRLQSLAPHGQFNGSLFCASRQLLHLRSPSAPIYGSVAQNLCAEPPRYVDSLVRHTGKLGVGRFPGETTGKVALITGITGQDGSYLAEFLLGKGYTVHGMVRRSSTQMYPRLAHLLQPDHPHCPQLHIHFGDMTDHNSLCSVLRATMPEEIYNLAGYVQASFQMPLYTAGASGMGVLALLEATRTVGLAGTVRFYQAPKLQGGLQHDCLRLGNLDARRDWGHAADCVVCMWLMLQQPAADDFVIASGKTTSVRQFALWAFSAAGIDLRFEGTGLEECGIVEDGPLAGQVVLCIDPQFYRPAEVDLLLGDPSKATRELGWDPAQHISVEALVREMVEADLAAARLEKASLEAQEDACPTKPVDFASANGVC
ncbi:hypothetical protein WJX72_006895 [[Myrmecia] bisecta]|uniref:GDP-mannose 4,6-dehydratase n=1 Tax=[Myrmecia] bisecta TaxID=41462 RepID=A0AAW1P9X2_9CHLO